MIEVSLSVFIAMWTVITIVVVATIVVVVRLLRKKGSEGLEREYLEERIKKIQTMIESRHETEWQLAMVEADKVLDYLLKARRFAGTTTGERLKVASYKHKDIRAVWEAHKVRNRIVHDHDIVITQSQAKRYWKQFQAAYRALM